MTSALDRPIVFGLCIILRTYLTRGSLARAKFGAVSRAKIIVRKKAGATHMRYLNFIFFSQTDGRTEFFSKRKLFSLGEKRFPQPSTILVVPSSFCI
jgi:hypothetical protein